MILVDLFWEESWFVLLLEVQLCVPAVPELLQNDQPSLREARQVPKSLSLRREHMQNLKE